MRWCGTAAALERGVPVREAAGGPRSLTLPPLAPPWRQAASGSPERLSFVHAAAEDTGLPAGGADLVSMCLVAHELPQAATRAILREAYRWAIADGAS